MSMSTYVTGFTPPDGTWQAMCAVWNACQAAGVPVPEEVARFFNDEPPDPAGVEVELPVREWNSQDAAGFELDVSAIPKQVKIIRFYNSW